MKRQSTIAKLGAEQGLTSRETEGRYVYAVIDDPGDQGLVGLTGLDDGQVYALGDGRHAAVLSDIPNRRLRPSENAWQRTTRSSSG